MCALASIKHRQTCRARCCGTQHAHKHSIATPNIPLTCKHKHTHTHIRLFRVQRSQLFANNPGPDRQTDRKLWARTMDIVRAYTCASACVFITIECAILCTHTHMERMRPSCAFVRTCGHATRHADITAYTNTQPAQTGTQIFAPFAVVVVVMLTVLIKPNENGTVSPSPCGRTYEIAPSRCVRARARAETRKPRDGSRARIGVRVRLHRSACFVKCALVWP